MAGKEQPVSWEARFIVEGMYLSVDMPFSVGDFSFERLTSKEYEHLWLPTLARVKVEATRFADVLELGKRRLQDFLGLYTLDGWTSPRIVGEAGFASLTPEVHIAAKPAQRFRPRGLVWSESFKEDLISANERLQDIDFSSSNYAYIRTALDYLLYSGEASRIEEKLIDLVISLEVLFSSGGSSYGTAHRVASLIGTDDNQRTRVFNDIRKTYNERSQLLHGSYSKPPNSETDEHVQNAGKYVKESVKKFLELASRYSREDINRKLDLAIGKAVF